MITGDTRFAAQPTQLLIDPGTEDGRSSGLHGPSAVKCCNLFTIAQQDVVRTIGQLAEGLMTKINSCLKAALQIE
jgi:mRNA interferase MazF